MNLIAVFAVPGFVGAFVVGTCLIWLNRRSRRLRPSSQGRDQDPTTDPINISHIRVAGFGGLGLVAMALVIAFALQSVGISLAIGLALGTLGAIAVIVGRRRTGPMRSSGRRPGANTTLSIETPEPSADVPPRERSRTGVVRLTQLPVETR